MDTVAKIQELDAADNILVLMAHDSSLVEKIPLFPDAINWWEKLEHAGEGFKERTRWLFCRDFLPALEEGKRGDDDSAGP